MSILIKRGLLPHVPRDQAKIDVGGLWWADHHADPRDIVLSAREFDVRAMEYQGSDISFLTELPQLDYLHLLVVDDPEPLHSLKSLRGLLFSGAWDGKIDFQQLPRLESFTVVECPLDEGGLETLYAGHECMRDLSIQRYRHEDLTPLKDLKLETLTIEYSRKLTSLKGIESLALTLRRLELHGCSNVTSLKELSSVPDLETLSLGVLRNITILEFVRYFPRLRRLDLFDLANVESLWPLADHPSLEFLMFGRVRDLDLIPLTRIPRLKLFLTGAYRWNLDPHSLPHLDLFSDDHPHVWEWHSLTV
jgi:hypothetical protein